MRDMIAKLYVLLGSNKKQMPLLFLLFIAISLLELLGIGLIVPFANFALFGTTQLEKVGPLARFSNVLSEYNQTPVLLCFWMFCVFLFKGVVSIFLTAAVTHFAQLQRVVIGSQLLKSRLEMDYISFLKLRNSDGVFDIQIASNDYFAAINNTLRFLSEGITLCFLIFLLAAVNLGVALVVFCSIGTFTLLYILTLGSFTKNLGLQRNFYESRILDNCQNSLSSFKEISLYRKIEYFVGLVRSDLQSSALLQVKMSILNKLPRQFLELLVIAGFLLAVVLQEILGFSKSQFIELTMVYLVAFLRMLPVVTAINGSLTRLRLVQNSVDRIYGSIIGSRIATTPMPPPTKVNFDNDTLLEISDIEFKYSEQEAPTLSGANLTVRHGEVIGIVGESGSGKSTLLALIGGFLTPTKGEIRRLSADKLLSRKAKIPCAIVSQNSVFFSGTIRENITLSLSSKEKIHDDLDQIIETCLLSQVVQSLPRGLDTDIGQAGSRLSAGQLQRVAVARMLFQKPRLILLDEATNALDAGTEKALMRNLKSHRHVGSMIFITHRHSLLEFCDQTFTIKSGSLEPYSN